VKTGLTPNWVENYKKKKSK